MVPLAVFVVLTLVLLVSTVIAITFLRKETRKTHKKLVNGVVHSDIDTSELEDLLVSGNSQGTEQWLQKKAEELGNRGVAGKMRRKVLLTALR